MVHVEATHTIRARSVYWIQTNKQTNKQTNRQTSKVYTYYIDIVVKFQKVDYQEWFINS